jgi:hypothetical protein
MVVGRGAGGCAWRRIHLGPARHSPLPSPAPVVLPSGRVALADEACAWRALGGLRCSSGLRHGSGVAFAGGGRWRRSGSRRTAAVMRAL